MTAQDIRDMLDNGEPDRALAALNSIPEDQRTPEEQTLFSFAVIAAMDWPTPGRMADLQQAISVLKARIKDMNSKSPALGLFNRMVADAYYQLGEYKDASTFYRKASDLEFGASSEEMLEQCRKIRDRPKDRESFRTRTQKAWEAFAPQEADLRQMMNDAIHSQKIWDKMSRKVQNLLCMAFRDVEWSWCEGDIPRLTLHPSRSKCIAMAEQYFFSCAPEELQERWEFTVGTRVPDDEDLAVMDEEGKWLCDMDVRVVRDKYDMLKLNVYHESLDPKRITRQEAEHVSEMVCQNIGDMVYLSLIRSIAFPQEPPLGDTVMLGDLLSTLDAMGYLDREDIWSLFLYRHPYTRIPKTCKPGEERRWRDDIVRGSTMDPILCDLYEEEMSEYGSAQLLAGSGAVPCFVVFPLKDQTDNPPALMHSLLLELEGELNPDSGIALGEAEGLHFGYLDLLAMDLQPALEAAASILRRHGIPWACWHSFFTTDRTNQLY